MLPRTSVFAVFALVALASACATKAGGFPMSPPPRPPEVVVDSGSDGPPCTSASESALPALGDQAETNGVRIAHARTVPPVSPPDHGAVEPDADLEQLLRDRLGSESSHYSVVIKDLRSGRGATVAPDREYYAASLFKLDVMYEIFHQRDAGLLNFDEPYTVSDYYWNFDLGPHLLHPCGTVSVEQALGAMMSVSDNVAAVMLQDRAGVENIDRSLEQLGLQRTRLLPGLPTTAADVAQLVEAIARGDGVSKKGRSEMLSLMRSDEVDDRLPAQLPSNTVVSHKTGSWSTATHDAGIVFGKKSTYVMVVMSDLGFDSAAATTEADLARIAWDYFEQ